MLKTPADQDLIQQEIDGACTQEERAALRDLLDRDPAARALHRDLDLVSRAVAELAQDPAPAALRPVVLGGIRAGRRPGRRRALGFPSGPRAWLQMAAVLVVAIGLVVAAGRVLLPRLGEPSVSEVGATMAPGAAPTASEIAVEGAGLSGWIRWDAREGARTLVSLELRAPEPVEIQLHYDARKLEFDRFTRGQEAVASLSVAPGRMVLTGRWDRDVTLALERLGDGEARLDFRAVRAGETLAEGSIRAGGGN